MELAVEDYRTPFSDLTIRVKSGDFTVVSAYIFYIFDFFFCFFLEDELASYTADEEGQFRMAYIAFCIVGSISCSTDDLIKVRSHESYA
jgi:hypothetical protein